MRIAQFNIGPYPVPAHIGDLDEAIENPDGEIFVPAGSRELVDAAALAWLERRTWQALQDIHLPRTGHARIFFANGRRVDAIALDAPLSQGLLHAIGNGIARAMSLAKGNEDAVETVVVSGDTHPNPYSGKAMAGQMLHQLRTIRLHPHAWPRGPYREAGRKTARNWCDAVPFHEALHAYAEPWAIPAWRMSAAGIGWVSFDGKPLRVVYPSGHASTEANVFPERCPNTYAETDIAEDFIETALAFLNGAALDAGRAELIRRLLGDPPPPLEYRIEMTPPGKTDDAIVQLTSGRPWRLQVRTQTNALFEAVEADDRPVQIRRIAVAEFRRLWHAGERFGIAG
jgi:hypothetical protein